MNKGAWGLEGVQEVLATLPPDIQYVATQCRFILLDNYYMSAKKVRDRTNTLMKYQSREAAFTQAVIEEWERVKPRI